MTIRQWRQPILWAAILTWGLSTITMPLAQAQEAGSDAGADVQAGAEAATPEILTIAVGRSEPGHLNLVQRIATNFNTRDGGGPVLDRSMIAVLGVEDAGEAMEMAASGRADLAFSPLETVQDDLDFVDRFDAMWKRPVAIEMLTIVTRQTRRVRDPRQLNGLKVEIAGDRVDRITEHMNFALSPHGIQMESGAFISSGDMDQADAFLRLCRNEYDVRVDMVIHPMPTFAGDLPCGVRFLSFNNLQVPEAEGIGTMRHVVPSRTYRWQSRDFTSLGTAVALLDPGGTDKVALRDALADYLDVLSQRQPGILDNFDAALWAGENPETE